MVNFIPENEMGVVALFAQKAHLAGFEIIYMGTAFPDAKAIKDNTVYRIEFEYAARNFLSHQHDPIHCDLIICWINDWLESPLPVIALSDKDWPNKISKYDLLALTENKRDYWQSRALKAERKLKQFGGDAAFIAASPAALDAARNAKKAKIAVRRNEVLRQFEAGKTTAEIASEMNCSSDTIRRDIKSLNGKLVKS